mgnify:CR=1 FL=1
MQVKVPLVVAIVNDHQDVIKPMWTNNINNGSSFLFFGFGYGFDHGLIRFD